MGVVELYGVYVGVLRVYPPDSYPSGALLETLALQIPFCCGSVKAGQLV